MSLKVLKHYKAADVDQVVRVLRSASVSCWTENDDNGETVIVVKETEQANRDDLGWVELGFAVYAEGVDFKLYEHDGKFWFDVLDLNVQGDELPTLIKCSDYGWKREETARRHAEKAIQELRSRLVAGLSLVDWF